MIRCSMYFILQCKSKTKVLWRIVTIWWYRVNGKYHLLTHWGHRGNDNFRSNHFTYCEIDNTIKHHRRERLLTDWSKWTEWYIHVIWGPRLHLYIWYVFITQHQFGHITAQTYSRSNGTSIHNREEVRIVTTSIIKGVILHVIKSVISPFPK